MEDMDGRDRDQITRIEALIQSERNECDDRIHVLMREKARVQARIRQRRYKKSKEAT